MIDFFITWRVTVSVTPNNPVTDTYRVPTVLESSKTTVV
jgi:hypothetical protein